MKRWIQALITKTSARAGLLALAALFSVAAAQAGEITLYSHSDFRGRPLELHDAAPNLRDMGFNDRASSIVVRSGRWEVCSDENFSGSCAVLERGEYPSLDPRLDNRISSVREVGGYPGNGGYGGDRDRLNRRPAINLYSGPNFGGQSISLGADANNLREQGFNDMTISIVVLEGRWLLCSDANYGGQCRSYGPGRYPDLGYGMAGAVSSVRLLPGRYDERDDNRYNDRYDDRRDERYDNRPPGGWNNPPPPSPSRTPVELFSGSNFGGDRYEVAQDLSTFRSGGFNDRIQSLVIHEGQWEFCVDADFRGRCRVFGPGRYPFLGELSNQLSSMRRVR